VSSSVLHTMLFLHNGKIVTINQLTHYESNQSSHIDNILPLIHSTFDLLPMVDLALGLFQDPSLIGTYQGFPHPTTTNVCVIMVDGVETLNPPSMKSSSESTSTPSLQTLILPDVLPVQTPQYRTSESPPLMSQFSIWKMVP
jgi:hypothetical protein